MEMFSSLPEGGVGHMDHHLQREIADQLVSSEKEPLNELRLAALLGKTLLGKNEELEVKLRRLQEFAEETLAAKQTLMRQLAETKDSLHFSNHLCEQQELKFDELEKSNNRLRKLCSDRQGLLEQKNSKLAEMEENLTGVRDENDKIKVELDKRNAADTGVAVEGIKKHKNGRSHCLAMTTNSYNSTTESEELSQLREAYGQLTVKLQNSTFQKNRLERQLEEILAENMSLTTNAEKTEVDYAELQQKVEELSENHFQSSMVTSPNFLNSTFSVPRINSRLPSVTESAAEMPFENAGGESLFSELEGTQFSALHHNYGEFLHKCTCSAGLFHKVSGGGGDVSTKCSPSSGGGGGSFKELFDEMFATLRQTAEVADRLIESGGK